MSYGARVGYIFDQAGGNLFQISPTAKAVSRVQEGFFSLLYKITRGKSCQINFK